MAHLVAMHRPEYLLPLIGREGLLNVLQVQDFKHSGVVHIHPHGALQFILSREEESPRAHILNSQHQQIQIFTAVLTSANLDQLKDLSALEGWGMFFFFREGPMGAPGGGGTPPIGGRPGGGGGPPGGGGGGGGGGIMPPGGGGGGGAGPMLAKPGRGGGDRGPPGGPGVRGGPPGTTAACL